MNNNKKHLKHIILPITLLLLSIIPFSLNANNGIIERIEPAFWWVGMKHPQLQLLIHGNDVAKLDPVIHYKGVRIEEVIKVQNPNYLFVNLLILDNQHPADFDIDFQLNGKSIQQYKYRLLARREGSAERQGFDNSDVMYLITPDRFANGDPGNDNNDNLLEKANRQNPGGRHGGDIAGILDHLDYIADMGFTALWINPLLENNQAAYSYHGYSITDFYKVDARFGTNEGYVNLSKQAKARGIKLIMDMVVNHCGSGHWWMKDLPTPDWINFDDKFVPTNHRKASIQDPYASKTDRKYFMDGWFVETMPDLNQRNPLLATYLIQNSIWWIEYADLAGIRMDTYPYPDMNFMKNWSCYIMDEYPDFNMVGEEWNGNPAIVAYWQKGKKNPNGYVSCLPGLMDFPLQEAFVKALNAHQNNGRDWDPAYETLANDFQYADPFNLVIFPDNHDMPRFYAQVGEDFDLFKMGLVYFLTIRGVPQIYYGTEILMSSPKERNDGLIRSDFPGGWQGDAVNGFTGKGLKDKQLAAKALMKKLLVWRKQTPAVQHGKLMHFAPENDIYVYFRYNRDQSVMFILNKNDQEQKLDLTRFAEAIGDYKSGRDVLTDVGYQLDKQIAVPAKTPLILVLEK